MSACDKAAKTPFDKAMTFSLPADSKLVCPELDSTYPLQDMASWFDTNPSHPFVLSGEGFLTRSVHQLLAQYQRDLEHDALMLPASFDIPPALLMASQTRSPSWSPQRPCRAP